MRAAGCEWDMEGCKMDVCKRECSALCISFYVYCLFHVKGHNR